MNGSRLAGHLAIGAAYTIFGLNIVFCKDIADSSVISPEVLFGVRMILAALIFWTLSLLTRGRGGRKMERGDLLKTALASLLGLVLPQFTFLKAITCSTVVDTSIMSAFTPVVTMIVAAIFLGEPITGKKVLGIVLSLMGIFLLIFTSIHFTRGDNVTTPLGFALLVANSISFASYLGIFRPLIQKYPVVEFMKWMFLFSFLFSIPISARPIMDMQWSALSWKLVAEIGYLVVFATFLAYFLIPLGQQRLRPTVVSMYVYLQPIVAVAVSIAYGRDTLDVPKVAAILLVFAGVFLVNRSRTLHPEDARSSSNSL